MSKVKMTEKGEDEGARGRWRIESVSTLASKPGEHVLQKILVDAAGEDEPQTSI